jgi:hypothetical protein
MRAILLGSVLAMVLVPAARQPAAPGLDPAGKWTFSTHGEDGTALTGTMEIRGEPGKYGGEITVTGMDQKLPITDVGSSSANAFVVLATTDDGAAVIKVWQNADGKLQSSWGPVKQIIPATVERAR